ncbi:hypothetical protein P3831_03865 [Pseudomonas aeruginosa]|uniref:hypothetical protein n=1 Tax=Pseudomonas aeruginosa TaxID=287 RepID=UPI001C97561C|nr:hypothetical protein [Pseudomonas aeruginosa]MBX5587500.1 hypothetical protein [Pseudomonas aeruginosa]MDP5565911.1 hypothetical protein [Pseudomonas aeruginosa]MDP5746580.1 hypothetical protein [Pseudomonas aeruginosa]MDP5777986.1 hypothetical protein [Pseudomonas aeruginosa]
MDNVALLLQAINGKRGELDAWLEVNSEDECRDAINGLIQTNARSLKDQISALKEELEIERQRLAACGVAALGYFNGCADAYKSASLADVLKLRAEHDAAIAKATA